MRRTESTGSGGQDLHALFARVIAVLTDGELTFPAPFDLASAAALAANDDSGDIAEKLFDVAAQRDVSYRVQIHATAPDVADREIISTTVPSTSLLITLLDGLIDEYIARQQHQEEGDPSGGQAADHHTD